jgi:hypothetical protein
MLTYLLRLTSLLVTGFVECTVQERGIGPPPRMNGVLSIFISECGSFKVVLKQETRNSFILSMALYIAHPRQHWAT